MKKAFTLTEIVVVLIVITLVIILVVPLTKRKMEKVDGFSYYLGYEIAKEINLLLYNKYYHYTVPNYIQITGTINDNMNVINYNTQISSQPVGFSCDTVLILSNGVIIYVATEEFTIDELTGPGVTLDDLDDFTGIRLYVDVNGKLGKSKLYTDIFPFYLLMSGKVVPGYDPSIVAGANNKEHLNLNVVYDVFSDGNRTVKLLLKGVNFRNAACATGYVKSPNYCKTDDGNPILQYEVCKNTHNDCRFVVNKPMRML